MEGVYVEVMFNMKVSLGFRPCLAASRLEVSLDVLVFTRIELSHVAFTPLWLDCNEVIVQLHRLIMPTTRSSLRWGRDNSLLVTVFCHQGGVKRVEFSTNLAVTMRAGNSLQICSPPRSLREHPFRSHRTSGEAARQPVL